MTEYTRPGPPRVPSRVHTRVFGFPLPSLAQDEFPVPERVRVDPRVRRFFLAQLTLPGTYRSGPLFGPAHLEGGVQTFSAAAREGYPGLQPHLGEVPFAPDWHYLLGLVDALSDHGRHDVDWSGTWLMAPNNRPGTWAEHEAWLIQAHELALIDEQHVLMLVGVDDGRVVHAPYLLQDAEFVLLPLNGEGA